MFSIYSCRGFSCCSYYQGVRNSKVLAKRELPILSHLSCLRGCYHNIKRIAVFFYNFSLIFVCEFFLTLLSCFNNLSDLLAEHFFLASPLACTMSFASLVFCVAGLYKPTTPNARDLNDIVHAKGLARKKRSASRVY